jgi:hypothetical protein
MPVKAYKVGPGELTFGTAGTLVDFTAQVTEAAVDWSEDVEDDVPTLDGGQLDGEATYTASLSGTFVQDLTAGTGVVPWSWTNKGARVPFSYTPNNDEDAAFTGVVRVAPLKAGGAVKSKPTSDFEWACIGEPQLVHGLAG